MGEVCLHNIFENFVNELENNEVLVVSNEFWGQELQEQVHTTCMHIENPPFKIEAVLFVRPQVELLIPTCFQWVIFSQPLDIEQATKVKVNQIGKYSKQLESLSTFGVARIHVVLADNTPSQFATIVGLNQQITVFDDFKVNKRFSPKLIHMFLYYSFLVKDANDQRFRKHFREAHIWTRSWFSDEQVNFSKAARQETITYFAEENSNIFPFMSQSDKKNFELREIDAAAESVNVEIASFVANCKSKKPNSLIVFIFCADAFFWYVINRIRRKF